MSITLVRAFLFVSCLVIGAYSFNSHHRTFLSRSITKLASSNNDNVVPPPSPPSSEPTKKGFGKVQVKVEQEVVKDAGTLSYEAQAKRGVPEYSIFIRPMNGTETEWIPVGSMTIPRDQKVSKVVLEVESEMLKGTFKLYPKLKAFYELQGGIKKEGKIFEYGYCLKAFPDEPIQIITEEVEQETNFFQNWLSKITNPLDTKDLNSDKSVTLKM